MCWTEQKYSAPSGEQQVGNLDLPWVPRWAEIAAASPTNGKEKYELISGISLPRFERFFYLWLVQGLVIDESKHTGLIDCICEASDLFEQK